MSLFAVAFRVQDGPNYDSRYGSLILAIEGEAIGDFWEEPTSFYLLTSNKSSGDLRSAILDNAAINSNDVLVILNLTKTKGHAAHGVSDTELFGRLMNQR